MRRIDICVANTYVGNTEYRMEDRLSLSRRVGQRWFESLEQKAMVSLLVAAGHLSRALSEICEARGVTHDWYNVLRILRGVHPEGHPRYEIAQRLIDRAPDVTRLLDRLEREGLVERYRSEEDLRLSYSRITEKGLALLEELDPEISELHREFVSALSRRETSELAELCGRILPE